MTCSKPPPQNTKTFSCLFCFLFLSTTKNRNKTVSQFTCLFLLAFLFFFFVARIFFFRLWSECVCALSPLPPVSLGVCRVESIAAEPKQANDIDREPWQVRRAIVRAGLRRPTPRPKSRAFCGAQTTGCTATTTTARWCPC